MTLSLNPSKAIGKAVNSVAATAANQVAGNMSVPNVNAGKAKLDALIAKKSGAIGSALNGMTGQLNSTAINNLSGAVQSKLGSGKVNSLSGTIGAGLNALGSKIQSIASSAPGLGTGLLQSALQGAAAKGNVFAGIAADLISTARSKNLPSAASLGLTKPGSIVAVYPVEAGDWRVKVQSFFGDITFPTTPTFSLQYSANYDSKQLVHANFPHPVYTSSSSGDIQITCEWPVETTTDGIEWTRITKLGRALTKMFYGSSDFLGNPPPICELIGYEGTLQRIPVVVKEFKVDFKDDVHYMNISGAYVPRLSTVSMTLAVVYSKSVLRGFNWKDYSEGTGSIPY